MRKTWIVENTWTCPTCSASNKGRHLSCQSCGAHKSAQVKDQVPDGDVAPKVIDPALLELAQAGRNWTCAYCGGQARNPDGACDNCAGPKTEVRTVRFPQLTPVRKVMFARDPVIGDPYRSSAQVIDEPVPDLRPSYIITRPLYRGLRVWHAGVAAAAVGLIGFVIWLFIPHDVDAQVASTRWAYTIELRERHTYAGEGWGRPGGKGYYSEPAFNEDCHSKYYGDENCNPYQCNPHQVSYTCNCTSYQCSCSTSCRDNGNGFSTCSQSCSTCQSCQTCYRTEYDTCYHRCPVYKTWCQYQYYDWPVIQQAKTSGTGPEVQWGEVAAPIGLQRIATHEEYRVDFADADDGEPLCAIEPQTLTDYHKYQEGAAWVVSVSHAGRCAPQPPAP